MIQPASRSSTIFQIGPFELDRERLLLYRGAHVLPLGPKVVETLLALAERPGEVVGKEQLIARLWPQGFVEESNLAQNIYILRKSLRPFWEGQPIETLARRGYRLREPVRVIVRAHAAPQPGIPRKPGAVSRLRRFAAVCACAAAVTAFGGASARAPGPSGPAQRLSVRGQQLYALGRYYWSLRTAVGLRKSVGFFEGVTRLDPRSALGYAGLADAYSMIVDYHSERSRQTELGSKAKRYAAHALALDARSPQALTAYAMTRALLAHDIPGAERHLREAIAFDPNYALAHEWYGTLLLMRGHTRAARAQLETAAVLDPVATATNAWLATEAYFDHRYAAAVAYDRQALDLDPNRLDTMLILALAQERLRDYRGALASLKRFAARCNCASASQLYFAGLYAHMGRRAAARAALESGLKGWRDLPQEELAIAYIEVGDRARALAYMRHARITDPLQRMFLALDPRLDPVRGDPRFRCWLRTG
ncbi:MAG: hypothetical protein NVS1B14_00210 [Vulcanimicrobiaceae bacterium]